MAIECKGRVVCVCARICTEDRARRNTHQPKPSRLAGSCFVLRGAAPPDSAAAAATPASTRWKGSEPHASSNAPAGAQQ